MVQIQLEDLISDRYSNGQIMRTQWGPPITSQRLFPVAWGLASTGGNVHQSVILTGSDPLDHVVNQFTDILFHVS